MADACDVNVSPDKRTIFLHNEQNLIQALKVCIHEAQLCVCLFSHHCQKGALEEAFATSRSTFDVGAQSLQQPTLHPSFASKASLTHMKHTRATSRSVRPADIDPELEQGQEAEKDREDAPNTMGSLPETETERPSHSKTDQTATVSPSAQPDKIGASQPLFFPDSDIEEGEDHGLAPRSTDDHGSHQEDESAREPVVSAMDRIRASRELSETRKRSASQVPLAQTVLSTTGAAWNRARPGGDLQDDGPRKRLRLAERDGRASFRFTLSQYARGGKKVAEISGDGTEERVRADARRSLSEETEEHDQLMEDEDPEVVNVTSKTRPRRISGRAGVTAEKSTDDAMVIEDPEPARPPLVSVQEDHPAPEPDSQGTDQDVSDTIDLTEDDASMTVVDTEVNTPTHSSKDHLPLVTIRCDLTKIRHAWSHIERAKPKPAPPDPSSTASRVRDALDTANVENAEDNAKASAALSRIITKTDFNKMQVIGQFNLGFIVTRWRKCEEGLDDLFVIDQHAADEKYNFETLQQTTVIDSLRLFRWVVGIGVWND
jgi:DNA mismatch repair protein PMS2